MTVSSGEYNTVRSLHVCPRVATAVRKSVAVSERSVSNGSELGIVMVVAVSCAVAVECRVAVGKASLEIHVWCRKVLVVDHVGVRRQQFNVVASDATEIPIRNSSGHEPVLVKDHSAELDLVVSRREDAVTQNSGITDLQIPTARIGHV